MKIAMLDFRIETFLAVCETKSYTKAAEKLCITQPAVSQHIKVLEERFGSPLFTISGRQFSLSQAGRLLYRYASAAQSEGRKVEALLVSGGGGISLRIGATRTIGEYLLPSALAEYIRRHPRAQISLAVENTATLLQRLSEGNIDFALIEGIFERKPYESRVFCQDRFVAVCNPKDPYAGKRMDLAQILDRLLIVREAGSGSRIVLENALAGHNLSIGDFVQILEIGNIDVIKALIKEGLGLAFLYERSIRDEEKSGQLSTISLKDFSIRHDYSFVFLKNSIFSELYLEFFDFIQAASEN